MLDFKKHQGSTLASEGTVASLVGEKGKISLIPKNYKDSSKRVAVILQKEDGTSAMVSCSKAVSEGLRDKSIKIEQLIGFNVVLSTEGVPFIAVPSSALVTIEVASLTMEDYNPSELSFTELIA